jgi:RHH-type transcriptional regulator, proline utilization regulon repressor / proline dehydrogenase / delta 1-pyrroline-5-carboxylate dehydrogenase
MDHLRKARGLLDGKPRSLEERQEAAIELAALMLDEARTIQTSQERAEQDEIAAMIRDPVGKIFTVCLTDQCFRSSDPSRVANQIRYLLQKFGVPKFLSFWKRLGLMAFRLIGSPLVPVVKKLLRRQTRRVILPGEREALNAHIEQREREGVRVNLNRLGEAILGEREAKRRLGLYLEDLQNPHIDYISVKISTICSQLNLLAWNDTLAILAEEYRTLLRAAKGKFINLDMEEYRDLHLTVALFKKVLQEPEFHGVSAGIVLQSYLPDSFAIQQDLTLFAMQRVLNGGAPVKIRIVKGANLAMERVEASLKGWPQAPYTNKWDVDANFKRMVHYAFERERAQAAHIGVASHNLFDIAYALLLRAEKGIEAFVEFEMLEGMADPIRRVVQKLSKGMLLYCPAATAEEFQYAIAYLVRRLDENTAADNFLRYAFDLSKGSKEWFHQTSQFAQACHHMMQVSGEPRRTQNRFEEPALLELFSPFENEADTDWTLPQNRRWAEELLEEWRGKKFGQIPLCVAGEEHFVEQTAIGFDPSLGRELYRYSLGDKEMVERAIACAKDEEAVAVNAAELMAKAALGFRHKRKDLIGAMVADGGKTIPEADAEVSEAIDFIEYYYRSVKEWRDLPDIEWRPKGTVLVAPPWNFPCSIPTGGVAAALAAGNSVIFKPAAETILVAYLIAQIFWEAGFSKRRLQFVTGEDETTGTLLVKDPRVNLVVLTGSTETAQLMARMRPGLDLIGETGGKNALIVTRMCDRDLAVRDLVQSAFGHAGQKCSACSLAILEAEVYDSLDFREQLKDAAASLAVGTAWDPKTKVNPLIKDPSEKLLRGLTVLDEGEEWLLQPMQDKNIFNCWSPGIKYGVKEGSYMHQKELFGPVLAVMRADHLTHALQLANGTRYGLTAGLHSLDEREQQVWMKGIVAGNGYINRGITGAIVRRQPFGGRKASSFGFGAKAGGPNYVTEFMHAKQSGLPSDKQQASIDLPHSFTGKELMLWQISLENYAYAYEHFYSRDSDPSQLLGQDNLFRYLPRQKMCLRINEGDAPIDYMRAIAAARICGVEMQVSSPKVENEEALINRLNKGEIERLRLISPPSGKLLKAVSMTIGYLIQKPVLANGRLELLNYLQEVVFSVDYHRFGNLGDREECYCKN